MVGGVAGGVRDEGGGAEGAFAGAGPDDYFGGLFEDQVELTVAIHIRQRERDVVTVIGRLCEGEDLSGSESAGAVAEEDLEAGLIEHHDVDFAVAIEVSGGCGVGVVGEIEALALGEGSVVVVDENVGGLVEAQE